MNFSLQNKIIAITGAGNGIGRAASIMLAKEGAIIIGIDKEKKSMEKLKLKIKKNLKIKIVDCTKSKEIKTNLKDIKKIDG